MSVSQGRFSKVGRGVNQNVATPRSFSGSETDVSTSTENLSHEERYVIRHTARQEPQGQEHLPLSNRSSLDVSTCSYNTLIIHQDDSESKRTSRLLDKSITDIPDDFLSESQVLKHLAKEVKTNNDETSSSSFWRNKGLRRDKLRKSKSQPDLRIVEVSSGGIGTGPRRLRISKADSALIDSLQHENSKLRLQLESYIQKLSKTQKLEQELCKVHRAQEELVQSSERRGRLEREARTRLQADCRRVQEMNRALRDQVELLSTQMLSSRAPSGDVLRRELNSDIVITQLIASNKELQACKERQDIELAAQRATLQEQRTHIDILDNALTNAQGNVVRLEEECRKKQMYVDLVSQLKQALVAQQQASNRREQTEHMLRLQLERELRAERAKSSASDTTPGFGSNASGGSSQAESAAELKRQLRERDEKIMVLEGENAKWEQRYIEESALRQAAIEAASLPKDAKIAALEKTSQETERLMMEARSEKMRHMDEQHAAQKRLADLQARLKDLESRLAERDAMIKVLQKHTYEKGFADLSRQDLGPSSSVFSSVSSALTSSTGFPSFSSCSDSSSKLYHSSAYHPTASSSDCGAKLSYHVGDSSSKLSYGGDSSSKLSFSAESYHGGDSAGQIGNYGSFRGGAGGQYSATQSFDDTKKSLDDQLKELDSQLDSQLLSKRGLCCFPGFSNTSTAPRKGKISQPLLAGVAGLENAGGFLGGLVRATEPPGRPEEIMLLEKQGRSSQRQRAGSLPPSSLPRPRRTRKLGEYGRLSDSETARNNSSDEAGSLNYARERKFGEYGRLSESESCKQQLEGSPSRPPGSPSSFGFNRLSDGDGCGKQSREEGGVGQRPPASPSSFSFGRFKTPPMEARKLDFGRKGLSTDETKLDFPNYPLLKTPPMEGSFSRKQSKEGSPSVSIGFGRYKTPPPFEPPKMDLTRCTPPKSSVKKSFIPPPRKLGDYGRFGGRNSSDSGEQRASSLTPNYRIRF